VTGREHPEPSDLPSPLPLKRIGGRLPAGERTL